MWIEDFVEFASWQLTCRLQTGMRGAFGKPQGTVARVRIGQPIMSVRTSDRHRAAVVEALRRAKFKFPGRQKVRFKLLHILLTFLSVKQKKTFCMLV
jgi:ribosomal protein L16/L10AE